MQTNRPPSFSGKLKEDDFYISINGVVRTLRPYTSLSQIAAHLQRMEFRTASGLDWSKSRLAGYIRNQPDLK